MHWLLSIPVFATMQGFWTSETSPKQGVASRFGERAPRPCVTSLETAARMLQVGGNDARKIGGVWTMGGRSEVRILVRRHGCRSEIGRTVKRRTGGNSPEIVEEQQVAGRCLKMRAARGESAPSSLTTKTSSVRKLETDVLRNLG